MATLSSDFPCTEGVYDWRDPIAPATVNPRFMTVDPITHSPLSPVDPDDLSDALAAVTVETQKLDRRQRQIQAQIHLPYSLESVWQVLTDYDALAEFIPNLAKSQRLEHPEAGIRIEQVGVQNALFLKFSARVVLDMTEEFPHKIHFDMVEGDFKAFSGQWCLQPSEQLEGEGTELTYTVKVWPKRTMPVMAVEHRLRHDLPCNLLAIRQRLESLT